MTLNAVERRLMELRGHWQRFTDDPDKRLLIWETPAQATRLIECFIEAQKHEAAEYATADLLIILKTPFEHSIQYSRALKQSLAGQYQASRDELAAQGIPHDWDFEPDRLPDSAYGFMQALRSFGGQHHKVLGHLAAVLMPGEVSNDSAFSGWLSRALKAGLPERLRLVVLDTVEAPRLRQLGSSGHPMVLHDTPRLDIMAVAQETFAQEAATGPAAVFRNLLMSLVVLVEKGTAAQARAKAADAFAFARDQGWDDQQVAVAMLVAGAQLKEKRFDEALETYRIANDAAMRATNADHPAGPKLLLQARFGEAGVQLAAGRIAEAASLYDDTATLALSIPDLILATEALRMAAFCYAKIGDREAALDRSTHVLAVGSRLKAEVRTMTTLPIAAIDMLRVLDAERVTVIEAIRTETEAGADKLLEAAEQRAAGLERSGDVALFRGVETTLAQHAARMVHEAEDQLQHVVTAAGERFRTMFAAWRTLLGQNWPLNLDLPGAAEGDEAPLS